MSGYAYGEPLVPPIRQKLQPLTLAEADHERHVKRGKKAVGVDRFRYESALRQLRAETADIPFVDHVIVAFHRPLVPTV